MKARHCIAFLFLLIVTGLGAQTKVEIVGGENLWYDGVLKHYYIVENVVIKHNGVTIQCDSAVRKTDQGVIEGFGNIYIFQPDTFTLSGGDVLHYDEATKTATVSGKQVLLRDQSMTLTSTSLLYNTEKQMGYYTSGADILSEGNTLYSKKGFYHRRANLFNFKDNVKLTSPDYTMDSDTLDYFSLSKTAFFYGPTRIVSKENTIVCNYGWYNTRTEKAQFSRGATIFSDSAFIDADSLLYDRNAGIGTGIANIRLYDSSNMVDVYGQFGKYYQKSKISIVSGDPLAIKADSEDTMYMMADTFYFSNDTGSRMLRAFGKTSIFQKEFQGNCDSLIYNFRDSCISLFKAPILWNEKNQISGDTMFINTSKNRIKTLRVEKNAFLAAEIKKNTFNQIAGKQMINYFDSNKLKLVHVIGNAESIYYLRNNETDSAEYTGVNKVACGNMQIGLDSSKVRSIRFYAQPEGKLHPVRQFPESEKFLAGLSWRIDEKLGLDNFLVRREKKQFKIPVPEPVLPEKIQKGKKRSK